MIVAYLIIFIICFEPRMAKFSSKRIIKVQRSTATLSSRTSCCISFYVFKKRIWWDRHTSKRRPAVTLEELLQKCDHPDTHIPQVSMEATLLIKPLALRWNPDYSCDWLIGGPWRSWQGMWFLKTNQCLTNSEPWEIALIELTIILWLVSLHPNAVMTLAETQIDLCKVFFE